MLKQQTKLSSLKRGVTPMPFQDISANAKKTYLRTRMKTLKQSCVTGNYCGFTLEQLRTLKGYSIEDMASYGITEEFLRFCDQKPNKDLPTSLLAEVWGVSKKTVITFKSALPGPSKWSTWTDGGHKSGPLLDAAQIERDRAADATAR